MKIGLNIKIKTKSASFAEKVVKSLLIDIETTSQYFERSSLNLSTNKNIIDLKIIANDITSAKASINTSLKWVEQSINILEQFSQD